MEHAHKSITIQGIVKALKARSWHDEVIARLTPSTREILEQPMSAKFHRGSALDEVYDVLGALHGPEAVESLLYDSTRDSMSGIAGPLAKLFLTTIGGTPRTLFSRFDTLMSSGTRGFISHWEDTGPKSGRLSISTENPAPAMGDWAWRGLLRYLLEFAGAKGSITALPRTNELRSAHFDVTWN